MRIMGDTDEKVEKGQIVEKDEKNENSKKEEDKSENEEHKKKAVKILSN